MAAKAASVEPATTRVEASVVIGCVLCTHPITRSVINAKIVSNIMIYNWNNIFKNGRDYSYPTADFVYLVSLIKLKRKNLAVDIGCGTGQLTRDLLSYGFDEVIGIDGSKNALDIAKSALDTDRIRYVTNTNLKRLNLKLIKGADLFITRYAFTYIFKEPYIINVIFDSMNNSSVFVIINPNYQNLPENKKNISEPKTETLAKLSPFFNIKIIESSSDYIFICKKKS